MDRIARFEKVSFEEYRRACEKVSGSVIDGEELDRLREQWENIKIPTRSTSGSAGYDFYMPCHMSFNANRNLFFPTGIRCSISPGWFLMLCPKSGLGNKYHMQLLNSIGICDSDYYYSNNEGHIHAGFAVGKNFTLEPGNKFMQGIFIPFGITEDDEAEGVRDGGFGSTGA